MKSYFGSVISFKLLLVGLLLRFALMPFFFHTDIKNHYFHTSFLKKGVTDIYQYLADNKSGLPAKDDFNYFPLTYFFLGGYQAVSSTFFGSEYDSWLWDYSENMINNAKVYRYLFLMKFPYLVLDILTALVLASFFEDKEKRKKAITAWLFNPFTLVLIYMFATFDIIPVLLSLIALLLAKKGRLVWSALFLGIASGFKLYPLLFLPLIIFRSKSIKEAIGTVIAPFGFLVLLVAPFWSKAFQVSTLTSGLTTRMIQGGIPFGFGENIYPAVVGMIIVYLISLLSKKITLENLFFTSTLLLYSLIHYHIQWLLWAAPFAVIVWIKYPKLRFLIFSLSLLAFSVPVLYNDKFMTFSLFIPISSLFSLIPTPFAVIQKVFDPFVLQSILHSALAGGNLVLGWKLLKEDE